MYGPYNFFVIVKQLSVLCLKNSLSNWNNHHFQLFHNYIICTFKYKHLSSNIYQTNQVFLTLRF